MCFAGGDHIIVGLVLLQHQPHRFNVFFGVTLIALSVKIAKIKILLQARLDARSSSGYFSGNKRFAAAWAFMVEEYAAASEHVVRLAIVHCDRVGIQLGCTVGTTWIERRCLALRCLADSAKHFGATGLIKLRFDTRLANSLENANSAEAGHVARVFRNIKTHTHMTLRSELINFFWLYAIEKLDEIS